MKVFDAKRVTEEVIQWIRDWFEQNGPGCNAVLGMSGGKDSTVAAALCAKALGKDRVIGVAMPDNGQAINDADRISRYIGIRYCVAPIGAITSAMNNLKLEENDSVADEWTVQTKQNVPPRVRMVTLYAIAQTNNGLVGYRIIYLAANGSREDYYRIITSNNKCEPVVQAPNSSSDKSYTYRYEDTSTLTFVTVSPSSAPTFKDNATPYIGKPTQKILFVNTFFEPIQLDIELTTHDADTISYMLENSQLRDLDNGLVTTYNNNNEIYHQAEHFTLKDQYSGKPVFEVKQNKTNSVDFSQTINDKIGQ